MTTQSYPRITASQLKQFMKDVFIGSGAPEEDAEISSQVLIASDLRGIESHGIGRLKMYYDRMKIGQHNPVTQFEIVRDHAATALVDGHNGVGMVLGYKAMNLAIAKARQFGMGSVAVRNSTHFGIDGFYALMAVKQNMIGMSFTNARPSVAPTFGVQPKLGTNPIAFGAPTDEAIPFLFDGATSLIQRGKVEVYARYDKEMPDGWVIDEQGNYLKDPEYTLQAMGKNKASLLPLGGSGELFCGYKGYGLATMVEILSASLQTANFLSATIGVDEQGKPVPFGLGHFFLAIDIESFVEIDQFKKTTGDILRELRASHKEPGQLRIYTAGEKEYENEIRLSREGIEINPKLQKEMKQMQQELGLSQYKFPF
jgi:LDH2 family malate/lactate/ureidoglycolate dehydrogenase